MSPAPRKKPQPKPKKVNVSERAKWKEILKDVDKDEIPVDLMISMTVHLIDGTEFVIDVQELLASGNDPEMIKAMLDLKLKAIDDYIANIDFYVNIDNVAKTVQPITDEMLKGL